MKTPERSVEEILMEHCEPDTGLLTIGKHDHDVLREIIQTERQKKEEMVEIERANFAEVLEQLREMVDGTDRMLVEYIDETIVGLTLTQPNNK